VSGAFEDEARERLQVHGYRVDFRQDVWCECWIRDGSESWLGRGEDAARAFEAALAAMLPSRLARSLWRGSAAPAPAEPGVALVRPGQGQAPSRGDASRHLAFLGRRVEALADELGLFVPERQRMAIMSWACAARAQTERFPEDEAIAEQVSAICRQLGELGKIYWPGSVNALQLAVEPSALPRSQLGGSAETWAEAAELSRRALIHLEATDLEQGLDARGWAMDDSPAPAEPEQLLDRVVDEVVERSGRLDRGAEPERDRAAPEPEAFARWSHRLRWVRPWTDRPRLWGQAFGRLRWWGSRRQSGLGPAAQGLEADFAPPGGWAALVGTPTRAERPAAPYEGGGRRLLLASTRRDPELVAGLERAGHGVQTHLVDPEAAEWTASLDGVEDVVAVFGLALSPIEEALEKAAAEAGIGYRIVAAPEVRAVLRGLRGPG